MTSQAGKAGVVSSGPPGSSVPNPRFLSRELWFMVDPLANVNYWRVRTIGATGNHRFNFSIPSDVNILTSVDLIGFPNANILAGSYALNANYAALGELENTHITSLVGLVMNATIDTLFAVDLLPVIPSWSPGDFVGCQINHTGTGTTVNYIGVRMRYQT